MADAVFNVAHASLLMLGLAQGDWDLVAPRPRTTACTSRTARTSTRARWTLVAARARELGALGATISGAGPTVLVWCHYEQTGARRRAAARARPTGWADVLRVPFEPQGADVRASDAGVTAR